MIFTRNPELGKVKTRLAKTVGDESALAIYKFLLEHTQQITKGLACEKQVHYSEVIGEGDVWDVKFYDKRLQEGIDLGARMAHAFTQAFDEGYEKVLIIGSDLYDLQALDIELAFDALATHQVVIGPALDGGYYLLGMTTFIPSIFESKDWGTSSVFKDTMKDLEAIAIHKLTVRNDIDTWEDIKDIELFQQFIQK